MRAGEVAASLDHSLRLNPRLNRGSRCDHDRGHCRGLGVGPVAGPLHRLHRRPADDLGIEKGSRLAVVPRLLDDLVLFRTGTLPDLLDGGKALRP